MMPSPDSRANHTVERLCKGTRVLTSRGMLEVHEVRRKAGGDAFEVYYTDGSSERLTKGQTVVVP